MLPSRISMAVGAAVLIACGAGVALPTDVASAYVAAAPGTIVATAGTGTAGFAGDGAAAVAARLDQPQDAVTDASGNVYIADGFNCRVRKVTPGGTITTVVGTGTCNTTGDGGPAVDAQIHRPFGLAIDTSGNLYIADSDGFDVRKVDPAGTITTFAGTGVQGSTGDHGPATSAELDGPCCVAVDLSGNVYIADHAADVVRKVSPTGIITTVAGTGVAGYTGDHGPATAARLGAPAHLAVDASGDLFIADQGNNVIRKVDGSGVITTVAGNGSGTHSGDFGAATSAGLANPFGVAVDARGDLFIAEYGGPTIRRVDGATGVITTYAGVAGSPGTSGNGRPASVARLTGPTNVTLDPSGDLLINDYSANQVRTVVQAAPVGQGYFTVASDGGIFNFGPGAGYHGSTGALHLNRPIVGMARTPSGRGYWLVASDGGIFNFGDAGFFGSTGALHLNQPIVGMAPTPDGKGYWLVAADGGIFNCGDAGFYGSAGGGPLNRPIVGMAAAPNGKGYWLVASDGGIFAYGAARFHGSAGALSLNEPIVGMAPTPDGHGYWLVASDGGIFNYGSAGFLGSTGALHLNRPIVGMAPTPDGKGYWLVAADGGIFNFGDAGFFGSAGSLPLNRPVVGMAGAA